MHEDKRKVYKKENMKYKFRITILTIENISKQMYRIIIRNKIRLVII